MKTEAIPARDTGLFAELGKTAIEAADPRALLRAVARLSVRFVADCCLVDLLEDDGRVRRLEATFADPARAHLGPDLLAYPKTKAGDLSGALFETGETVFHPEVSKKLVESLAEDAEHLSLLSRLDVRAFIAVPLVEGARVTGGLVFVSSGNGRRYGRREVQLAEEFARLVGRALEKARAFDKAMAAVIRRDEMLGAVAHDLRNPLAAMVLCAAIMKRGLTPGQERELAALARFRSAAQRMERLISDLLDVGQLEAGKMTLDLGAHAPASLISEAIDMNGPLAAGRELKAEVAAELPLVRVDRQRILQVFANLIGNAAKFTEEGGHITVGVAREARELRFWVRDDGAGIPAETAQHLFTRFWRGERKDHRGVGLGLSICKGIVEVHGGRIWAESEPGSGSLFSFTLPLPRQDVAEAALQPAEA